MPDLPYRDFYYPLNVLMHLLMLEEGSVHSLHYGLFERNDEPIGAAQERSTHLLLSRLPPPPARLLDVGLGLGTTLDRLTRLGYRATGITPDDKQIASVRSRFDVDARCIAFEAFDDEPFDALIFQESSQYIDSEALFANAEKLSSKVVVLDEFATRKAGELHLLDDFLHAAARHGFEITEEVDLSARAAPTVDYFLQRFARRRQQLIDDIGVTSDQIDELIESGERYRDRYARGDYVYRLFELFSSS